MRQFCLNVYGSVLVQLTDFIRLVMLLQEAEEICFSNLKTPTLVRRLLLFKFPPFFTLIAFECARTDLAQ